MKSVVIQRAAWFLGVLFFACCGSGWADPDPNKPDTMYLECSKMEGKTLIIKLKFVTDNVGDSNKLVAFTIPLEITNSNPAAKPVLDTTVSATFSGSAAEGFNLRSTKVRSNGGNPSIFPLQYGVRAHSFSSSIGAGRYLYANLILHLQDTTTICVDTFAFRSYRLLFTTDNAKGYVPEWRDNCCLFPAPGIKHGSPKKR